MQIFYPNSPMLQRVMTHTMVGNMCGVVVVADGVIVQGLVWFLYLITGNVPGTIDVVDKQACICVVVVVAHRDACLTGRRDSWAFLEKEYAGQRVGE